MTASLLPQSFWFRLAIPCAHVEDLPALPNGNGTSRTLSDRYLFPDLAQLEDDQHPWATVKAAWNARGICLSIRATGVKRPEDPSLAMNSIVDVQVWIDTRDTRNVSRATRFCHRFVARVLPNGSKNVVVSVAQRPIARAIADAPLVQTPSLQAEARIERDVLSLEWFIPAEVLHGFDPETNRRLGFTYQISCAGKDDQYLSAGREFPIGENPSLWSTLELTD